MKINLIAMLLAGVAVSANAGQVRKLYLSEYRDRMAGAWAGQSIGVTYGEPTEFKAVGKLLTDAQVPPWKPERINGTFNQDDLYVEMTFLETLEQRGIDVTCREAGIDFANSGYRLWCANNNARNNLRNGIAAPDSSHPANHPTPDDIDYQIESDFSGIIAPGMPVRVMKLGETFGRIMNYGDGLYAGQFLGALYAEAFFEKDRVKTVRTALEAIPSGSGYAEMVREMLVLYAQYPKDWALAWSNEVARFDAKDSTRIGKVSWPGIDVKVNGAMVLLGYLWGEGDIFKTMDIATRGGFDSDCNPSSSLGVLGTQIGFAKFGPEYVGQLSKTTVWSHTSYTWPKLLDACERLARQFVVAEGGSIGRDAKGEYFLIPVRKPSVGAAFSSKHPGPGGTARITPAERREIRYLPTKAGATSEQRIKTAMDGISFAVPQSWPCPELTQPNMRAVWLEGEPLKGKPTRVFAYVALPEGASPSNRVPGVVLAHGGGGTAYPSWPKVWLKHGYAVILIDNCGCMPIKPPGGSWNEWIVSGVGGPKGWGRLDLAMEPASDQWPYHAVGALVRAHSYLRAMPEVDAAKTGITGISWGGFLTILTAAVDKRFKFAMPVYACGFYEEMAKQSGIMKADRQQTAPAAVARWDGFFDPKNYAPHLDLPVFWFASSNDFAFPFDLLQRTARLAKPMPNLAIRVRMGHGHGPTGENMPELFRFADQIVKGAPPLPHVGEPKVERGIFSVPFDLKANRLKRVEFNWCAASPTLPNSEWKTVRCPVPTGTVFSAPVPATAKWVYANFILEGATHEPVYPEAVVSSPAVFVKHLSYMNAEKRRDGVSNAYVIFSVPPFLCVK